MPRAPRGSFLAAASSRQLPRGSFLAAASSRQLPRGSFHQALWRRMQNAELRRQTVPQQAQQAPRPQAKATTRIGVPGCRLTGFKPLKRLKCLAGHSNGSRAPHGRSNGFFYHRQKPPQGHSNGSRHPPGRSNGFL